MFELLTTFVPIFLVMLSPAFVPVVAIATGSVSDRMRPPVPSPAEAVVERVRLAAIERRATSR